MHRGISYFKKGGKFLILALLLATTSLCTKDEELFNEDYLCKEWKIVSVNNQSTSEYLGEENLNLIFEKNGQFTTKFIDKWGTETETGEWFWTDDKKSLNISIDGDLTIFEIIELTETDFSFIDKNENALFKCVAWEETEVNFGNLTNDVIGTGYGIKWVTTPDGKGIEFSQKNETRVEYPFEKGLPHEGTIELKIKVSSGYSYDNYKLNSNQQSAILFNTGPSDVWFEGAMWLNVDNSGNISLTTALTAIPTSHTLLAEKTNFRFNQWHVLSFSFGSEGQYISLNGEIVASNKTYTEPLQSCGDRYGNRVTPAVGEALSVFWKNNQYDQGFEGVLGGFRASQKQKDWVL